MNRKRLVPIALAFVVLFQACSPDKVRTAAKAENVTAQSIKSIATLVKSMQDTGQITAAQALQIKGPLSDVNQANGIAIQATKDWLNAGAPSDPSSQARVLDALAKLSSALAKLNDAGLLHIKNPDSRAAFGALIVAIQGAVGSVVIILVKK